MQSKICQNILLETCKKYAKICIDPTNIDL